MIKLNEEQLEEYRNDNDSPINSYLSRRYVRKLTKEYIESLLSKSLEK